MRGENVPPLREPTRSDNGSPVNRPLMDRTLIPLSESPLKKAEPAVTVDEEISLIGDKVPTLSGGREPTKQSDHVLSLKTPRNANVFTQVNDPLLKSEDMTKEPES